MLYLHHVYDILYLFDTDLTIHRLFFEYFGILGNIGSNGGITDRFYTTVPYDGSIRHHFRGADRQDVFNQYIDTAVIGCRYTGKNLG